MKKISKIIVYIISTIAITFLLPLSVLGGYSSWTISSNWGGDKYHVVTNGDVCLDQTTQDSPSRSTNLAYNKTGKQDTDGNWSTYTTQSYWAYWSGVCMEHVWPVDLGASRRVNKVMYKLTYSEAQVPYGGGLCGPTTLEGSTNNSSWNVVASINPDGGVHTVTFPGQTYRYWRLHLYVKTKGALSSNYSTTACYEFQLYEAGYWSSGYYASPSKDTTYSDKVWGGLVWSASPNDQTLKFQIATNNDNAMWLFQGPDGSTSSYYTNPGQRIWSGHNGDRYIKVKAYFWGTGDKTPVLHDVTVCWNPYPDAPTLTAPKNNAWIDDNTPLFDWDFKDLHPGSTQEGFHLIIDDSPDFPGVYYDSGFQESTISQWQFPDGTIYTTIPDGIWYWKCCTKNNYDFWGATSTYGMFRIDTTPPPTPVMVPEPKRTPGLQNLVSWGSVGDGGIGGVKYYVQCSSDNSFISEVDNSGWIGGDSYEFGKIEPLKDGVTYYYRVRAKDALHNESEYSASVWSRQDNTFPVITDYYASPHLFSPNGDGINDTTTICYTLSKDCTASIKIYDWEDNLKRSLIPSEKRSFGANFIDIWNGKDDNGYLVEDGTYTFKIDASDLAGHEAVQVNSTVIVDTLEPVISNVSVFPNKFSPNKDEYQDTVAISYDLSEDSLVTIKVYDSDGKIKRTLIDGGPRSQGSHQEIWDGEDGGEVVDDGEYTIRIDARDLAGNLAIGKEVKVTVENVVRIVSTIPEDNGYFVIGEDTEIKIRFNKEMSSSTMIPANISMIDEDGMSLALNESDIVYASSTTTIIPSQTQMKYCTRYTLKVSQGVTDIGGNSLTKPESFSFTTLIPEQLTTPVRVEHKTGRVRIDNPSESFPKGSKGFYINLIDIDIPSLSNYIEGTARILRCYEVDDSGNQIDINQLDSPVTISIPYPSDTKARKNLKIYFYNKDIERWELVKGSGDTNPDDGDYYVTGQVSRTNTEYCVRGFVVGALIEQYSNYPNPFKAGKEKTTIEYDLKEDAKVTISVYDLLGQLVRRIEIPKGTPEGGTQGINKVSWYGKNERGRVVANGGYYCVVEADTETGKHMRKARKIMVIK